MLRAETAPDTALKRWLVATSSIRCSESVIAPWLGTASAVTHFPQTADRHFDRGVFATIFTRHGDDRLGPERACRTAAFRQRCVGRNVQRRDRQGWG